MAGGASRRTPGVSHGSEGSPTRPRHMRRERRDATRETTFVRGPVLTMTSTEGAAGSAAVAGVGTAASLGAPGHGGSGAGASPPVSPSRSPDARPMRSGLLRSHSAASCVESTTRA